MFKRINWHYALKWIFTLTIWTALLCAVKDDNLFSPVFIATIVAGIILSVYVWDDSEYRRIHNKR